jgi:hypothetical protein
MTVNPYLLHVYWQISEEELVTFRHTLLESNADARPVLRFYDIPCILFDGTNARRIFDVEVDLRVMKWNVPIWSADKSYVIDLGYKAPDGRFYQIARSNVVNVPRAEPSRRIDERYLRVEGGQIKSPAPVRVSGGPHRRPVEAVRMETVHEMEKDTWGSFKGKAEQTRTRDPARTRHGLGEASNIPCHEAKTAIGEEQEPDLVHFTREKFSFGLSSMPPAQGTRS